MRTASLRLMRRATSSGPLPLTPLEPCSRVVKSNMKRAIGAGAENYGGRPRHFHNTKSSIFMRLTLVWGNRRRNSLTVYTPIPDASFLSMARPSWL